MKAWGISPTVRTSIGPQPNLSKSSATYAFWYKRYNGKVLMAASKYKYSDATPVNIDLCETALPSLEIKASLTCCRKPKTYRS
eukprot:5660516-Pyramimonas_sp.AAC.1